MADNQPTPSAPSTASAEPKGFSIVNPGERYTMLKIGKTTTFLNHDSKPAKINESTTVPVATQEFLRDVYNAHPTYARFVKAPKGHVAPWEKAGK